MSSYNIQTQQQGAWVHYTTAEDKETALETAKRIFGNKACSGVRVVQIHAQPGRAPTEIEVHCETRVVKVTDTIRFSQIDWAPPACAELEEYYASPSRRLMARVLRDYCDKMAVTPTELLYNAKEATRIQDRGTLVMAAIDKVATLQADDDDNGVKNSAQAAARNAEITKAVEQMQSRARRAEKFALPKLKDSFHEVQRAVKSIETQDESPAYVAKVVLAQDLSTIRDWLGKVCRLCKLAEIDQEHPDSVAVLDGVIADSLAGSVVQDVLGFQPNLGHAIIAMIDLAEGKLIPEQSDAGQAAAVINTLCGQGKLPESRLSLIDRAHRQLANGGPLSRNNAEKERDEFMRVRDRLLTPSGLYNGAETAEALSVRYARLVEAGGQTGRRTAFNGVFYSMPDRAASILYLCAVAHTNYAKDCADDIAEKFDTILNLRSVMDMTRQGLSPKERMQRVTFAHAALAQSEFPEPKKSHMLAHLDGLLDRYVMENKLPEKLDNPKAAVKDRAITLAQFCGSGVLPKGGKALNRFLPNLLALVSQPDFDARFTAGMPDAEQAQKALRSFRLYVSKLAST